MPVYGVSVTKSSQFQGGLEKWSNVYHYFCAAALDATLGANLVDQIAVAEKLCHTANATFEDGRVWEVGGSPAENETIIIQDLSGTGSMSVGTALWKEACHVVRCDTNRTTTTGKRIYLRKYYHAMALPVADATGAIGQTALASGNKTPFQTCLETLREVTLTPGSVAVFLCAPGGQQVSDTRPVTVLDFLHTRQYRR